MNSNNSMRTYCVVCKKDTENENPKVFKTMNDRMVLKLNCSVCGNNLLVRKKDLDYYQILE